MATTRIVPLHTGKGRKFGQAIQNVINYVCNPEKTEQFQLISSFGCDSRSADAEFIFAKQEYIRKTGRVRGLDDVIAYHVRQSFVPGEITPQEANRIGVEFAARFTKEEHAFIVCTHTDKAHIHNHIIWSAVDLECDRKFRNFWGSTKAVRELSDTICVENGLSIVKNPQKGSLKYNQWLEGQKAPSHRERIRMDIDEALEKKPENWEKLFSLLKEKGYDVSRRGKNIILKREEWKRTVRLSSLGEGYTEKQLEDILTGKKAFNRHKNRAQGNRTEKISLVIDIQRKLQDGKGPGYERWAKVFNLKQMAKTLNYLTENGLTDYAELEEKTKESIGQYETLSTKIKGTEKRMKEISELRKQIFNYLKTKDTYIAYRKAGYSKKFLADHESEIILHKAAKAAFNNLHVTKLPTLKSLEKEYNKLLEEKKEIYEKYREVRAEMRQLLTVKENVDRILEKDEEKKQRMMRTETQRGE